MNKINADIGKENEKRGRNIELITLIASVRGNTCGKDEENSIAKTEKVFYDVTDQCGNLFSCYKLVTSIGSILTEASHKNIITLL